MKEITQDIVRELFDYRDSELYWKKSGRGITVGALAGGIQARGYRSIKINRKQYRTHRLIFLYHNGYLPEFLDHIDCDKSNNDITNLREATTQENGMNQKKTKSYNGKQTSSRFKGVTWNKQKKKWWARIQINRRLESLGLFTSETEAAEAYNTSAIESFGEFAHLNVIPQPL